jgi:hypothetical protein
MSNDLETRLDRAEAAFGRTAGSTSPSSTDKRSPPRAKRASTKPQPSPPTQSRPQSTNLEPLTVEERVARIEKAVNSHFRADAAHTEPRHRCVASRARDSSSP